MVRIHKDPDVRRAEILDVAEKLFINKGYHETSVMDITRETGVAKSTFFYYFKTKEEILDAIVHRLTQSIIQSISSIANDPGLSAVEKIERMLIVEFQLTLEKRDLVSNLHEIPNADMHQRLMMIMLREYTPFLSQVLDQGTREGIFHAEPFDETAEFLHVGIRFLFDAGLFPREMSEYLHKIPRMMTTIERLLGAPAGTLQRLADLFLSWYSQKDGQVPLCL